MCRDAAGDQHVRHFPRSEDARSFKGSVTAQRREASATVRRTLGDLEVAQRASREHAAETLAVRAAC
jgi:hypothetical protein